MSQIGSFPQVGVKIKNVWNHQIDQIEKKNGALLKEQGVFPQQTPTQLFNSSNNPASWSLSIRYFKSSGEPNLVVDQGRVIIWRLSLDRCRDFRRKEVGVSKNKDTPKWMIYNKKPY